MPIAMSETPLALTKDALPLNAPATVDLQVADRIAQVNLPSQPAVSRMDPLPAPMAIEPLALDTPQASPKVARAMRAALRAPVIPTVRIAELRPVSKTTRTFTTAFSSDISAETQSSRLAPSVGYAASSTGKGAVDMTATPDIASGNINSADAENTTVQSQSEVPAPEFGGPSEPQQLEMDLTAPSSPESSAAPTGEIPAS
jgi:hypothetical protein